MPPKPPAAVPASQSVPPPASPSPPPDDVDRDAQDLLVIQDLMDTLDQIPAEMTRVHADLNELGAVLYSTLQALEGKLNQLIDWLQDPKIRPEQRFQLLMEIAEEAARYKLGGDDKIRVAAGACDGIMSHQKHIDDLLKASSLLESAPPSPYTTALTLTALPTVAMSRRQIARAQNSPFTGGRPGYAEGKTGDTPTKKKKSRLQQLGRDDDEVSVGGRKVVKKKKTNPRAASPTDSVASGSFGVNTGKDLPRTARQLAAAQNKARKAELEAADGDSDESEPERLPQKVRGGNSNGQGMAITQSSDSMFDTKGGLGLDIAGGAGAGAHSRDPSGGRSGGGTPTLSAAQIKKPKNGTGAGAGAGTGSGNGGGNGNGNGNGNGKRGRDEDDDSEEDRYGGTAAKGRKTTLHAGGHLPAGQRAQGDGLGDTDGEAGGDGEGDGRLYCTCKQVSYGEMIGCDDDECEIEWYHIGCIGFMSPPDGNWICPACSERKKREAKGKKTTKGKARR